MRAAKRITAVSGNGTSRTEDNWNQGRGKKLNRQIDNRHFWGTNYGVILEGEEIEGLSSYIIVNAASP